MKLKLFLLLLLPLQLFAGTSHLNGTVIDAATQKPAPGAKAFINRSMKFSISDSLGKFSLIDTLSLPVELVVTMPGYETLVYFVNDDKPTFQLRFELVKKKHAFTPIDSSKIPEYEDLFLRHFFGITYNVKETFIINPSVLRYKFDEASGTLSVTADGLINIINDGLGYMIHYQLDTFNLRMLQDLSEFNGYCFFTSLSTNKPFIQSKWEMRRQLAYKGSMLHFMNAMYANEPYNQGFKLRNVVRVFETEKGYKSALKSKDMVRAGSFMQNGNKTSFADVAEGSFLTSTSQLRTDSANQVYLHSPQPILVEYEDKESKQFLTTEEMPPMISLIFFGKEKIKICSTGMYYNASDLYVYGFMKEKISDLLPLEYVRL